MTCKRGSNINWSNSKIRPEFRNFVRFEIPYQGLERFDFYINAIERPMADDQNIYDHAIYFFPKYQKWGDRCYGLKFIWAELDFKTCVTRWIFDAKDNKQVQIFIERDSIPEVFDTWIKWNSKIGNPQNP